MKKAKILLIVIIFAITCPLFLYSQEDVQAKIKDLETLLNNDLSPWKLKNEDLPNGEKIELIDSGWDLIQNWQIIRGKILWLRYEFRVPEVYSGIKTERSKINLNCRFRGVGKTRGKFFINGILNESFDLEFGNQATEIKKIFHLTTNASHEEKMLLAFRVENFGKSPVIERNTLEAGCFFQIQESRFNIEAAQDAHRMISQFLLDLKIGALLLDFATERTRLAQQARPVSMSYQKLSSSKSFQNLRQIFKKALGNFPLSVLQEGNFVKVKAYLHKFYQEVRPISRFAKSYTIFAGGNSHIDLAWLWRWGETVEVAKETFSTIMDNMDEYTKIVYIQSQAQTYKWMEEYYPDVFERIRQKVKEGRWEIVGGMWVEPDCNLIDGESFIRQILYGKRYFKEKFGIDVKMGWNPDSFGYNWNIPQFFRKSGINAFVTQKISWNDTNVFPYFFFWWEAPDGSRVLSYFPPTGYVGRLRAERMASGLKYFERNTGQKNMFVLYGLGNHGGGPNREMLNRVNDYKKQRIFPEIEHSSFSNYLKHIKKEDIRDLPVWKDELYLEYHRGTYTTQAETKRLNRKSEVLLSNTEKISSIAFLLGKDISQKSIKTAWEKVMLNQFHDILPGSSINPVYNDAKEFYLEAQKLAENEKDENLMYITTKIDTARGEKGIPLFVFNSLSWDRDGLVRVKLLPYFQDEVTVLDDSGKIIPSQILRSREEKILCFSANKVPSLGCRIYKIQKGGREIVPGLLNAGETTLENRYFRITVHPESGNIISIFDKIEKREVLASSSQGNQLQLLEDIPQDYDAWNIQYTGRSWHLDKADSIKIAKKGPVIASLMVEKSYLGLSKSRRKPTTNFPSSFFTQEIILYEDIPRIDIDMRVDWWENHVLLKVAFPVAINSDNATYEIPFAYIQRPTTRNTDWEKARFEVSAIRWADFSDGKYGVSLLNESKYGHDIEGNVMRLTLLRSPLSPDPVADRGKHCFSYALYPHKGDWREADTVRRGYEFNYPLIALFVDSHPGEMPPEYSFFKVSASNIILVTVKKTEDRETVILRFYEAEGINTDTLVTLFRRPKEIYELDLMENRQHLVSFNDKSFTLKFGRSEIKTIELVY